MDLAWNKAIHLDLDLNQDPPNEIDVDNNHHQLSSFVKHIIMSNCFISFFIDNPLEFSVANIEKMQYFMEKLNKMSITNFNRMSSKTIDHLTSLVYDVVTKFSQYECIFKLRYLHFVYIMVYYIEKSHLKEKLCNILKQRQGNSHLEFKLRIHRTMHNK